MAFFPPRIAIRCLFLLMATTCLYASPDQASVVPQTAIQVDLDYIYDPDPAQTTRNLDALIRRIDDLDASTVFLQAFADPDGSGLIKALYFQNRYLPVRSDLFNRVATAIKQHTQARVFAWMPVLSFDLSSHFDRVMQWDKQPPHTQIQIDNRQYLRLSPFDHNARQAITEIYEDLASANTFDGILFHDDALMGDYEDASPAALQAYRRHGLPTNLTELNDTAETRSNWLAFKQQALDGLIDQLIARVRKRKNTSVLTARNIYAQAIADTDAVTWTTQDPARFLERYDWTLPMAMPRMEGISPDQDETWLRNLVAQMARYPDGLSKTIFELQTKDWSRNGQAIDTATLQRWIDTLRQAGALHIAWYPDDFLQNTPDATLLRTR